MKKNANALSVLATGAAIIGMGAVLGAPPSFAEGDEIRSIELVSRPQASNPQAFQAAELIAQEWRKLGLDVSVRGMPRTQHSDLVWYNRDKWDTTMWQMVGRPERSDPDEVVFNLFHSSTAPTGYNFVGYINPEYDALAEKQRITTDPEARKDIIFQAQEMINDDQPYAFLVHPKKIYAFNNKVWNGDTMVDQAGLGIKNFWTFIGAEPLGEQKDMVLNSSEAMNSINPLYISGATDSWVTELIWDRMLRIGPDGLAEPWAAESFEWLDETTINVTMREGMMWHDGKPVTIEDVIFSFEAPAMGDEVPMYKPFVSNIDSIDQIGDRTVQFKLKQPNVAFLTSTLSKINLVPKHIWEPILAGLADTPDNAESYLEETPIGSGPFKYVRWLRQEEVVLEANPEHWSAPKMDRWILRIVPNVEATIGMLSSGDLNFLSDYTGDPKVLIAATEEAGDLTIVESVDIGFQFLAFNLRRPPFDDVAFRKALSTAINRKLMAGAAWQGYAIPSNSHVSPALAYWHKDGIDEMTVGLDEAKAILDEAGYEMVGDRLHYPDGQTEQHAN